jgi:hypothetical protein
MAAPHFGQYIDRLLVEKSPYLITEGGGDRCPRSVSRGPEHQQGNHSAGNGADDQCRIANAQERY